MNKLYYPIYIQKGYNKYYKIIKSTNIEIKIIQYENHIEASLF